MRWQNIDDPKKIITPRRYARKSDEEKKEWKPFDENKVLHGDILNTIGGGLLEDSDDEDDVELIIPLN
jgi:hypothetical protein